MSGFGALGQFALGQQAAPSTGPGVTTTWNPADKHADLTLSPGNLTVTKTGGAADGYTNVRGTLERSGSSKWYFETTITNKVLQLAVGIANLSASLSNYLGNSTNSVGFFSNGDYGTNDTFSNAGAYIAGDIIGVLFEPGVSVKFYKNGTLQGTVTTALTNAYPISGAYSAADAHTTNFGATSFSSLPAGATAWGEAAGGGAASDDDWFWWHFANVDESQASFPVTATISGVASAHQIGGLTAVSSNSVTLSGIPSAGGVGSVIINTGASVSVPIVAQGAVGLAGSITQAGQFGPVPPLGLVNEAGEGLINEAGEFLTYAEPASVSVNLPAVTANGQAGSPQGIAVVNATANPTTVSAAGAPGTPTVTAVQYASVTLPSASSAGAVGQTITLQSGVVLIPSASAVGQAGIARPQETVSVSLTSLASAGLANPLVPVASYIVTLEIVTDETLPTVFAVEMYPALVT